MTTHNDANESFASEGFERLVESAERFASESVASFPGHRFEVYQRWSRRVRVRIERFAAGTIASSVHEGDESGSAVRVLDARAGRAGFGAAAGSGVRAWSAAAGSALGSMGSADGVEPMAEGATLEDLDPGSSPAPPGVLRDWLDETTGHLASRAPEPLRLEAVQAWVESGITREILVNSTGARTARSRARTWAVLTLRWSEGDSRVERPRILAVRGGGAMPSVGELSEEMAARPVAGAGGEQDGEPILVLLPGPAALLVHALARVLHGPGGPVRGIPAGPGYVIQEDPARPDGLFGGSFDDTGRPASTVLLGDGSRAGGRIVGPGHAWRASFRDPPGTFPTNLTVSGGGGRMPRRGAAVTDLRIHALGPESWVLDGTATILREGRPTGRGGRFSRVVRPRDLPARCLATAGVPVSTATGVLTPALALDL